MNLSAEVAKNTIGMPIARITNNNLTTFRFYHGNTPTTYGRKPLTTPVRLMVVPWVPCTSPTNLVWLFDFKQEV